MVPAAVQADLHRVDPKLAVLVLHLFKLGQGLDTTGVLTELIAKDISQFADWPSGTDRTLSIS